MKIGELKPNEGSKKNRKRVGRGESSGHGKTSGRGHKGQLSRSGASRKNWLEGGQMPLVRRIPKKGFNPPNKKEYQIINVRDLNRFEEGNEVTIDLMRERGLVSRKLPVKLLGEGELRISVSVQVNAASRTAIEKVEKIGGKVQVIK
ncbi:50S ribosomal protein L15 [bacterium]|nr:MAG: 50S ribosomal protein L15 [bacterium]